MTSNASDSLPKPKVRFTSAANDPNNPGPFHGPRIREIVTLKRPVRLVPIPVDPQSSHDLENPLPNPSIATPPPENPLEPEVIILSPPDNQITPEKSRINSQTLPKAPEVSKPVKKPPIDIEVLQKKLESLKTSENPQKVPRIPKKTLETKDNAKNIQKNPPKLILKSKNTSESLSNQAKKSGVVKKTGNKENIDKKAGNLKKNVRNDGKTVKTVEKKRGICSEVPKRPAGGPKPLENDRKIGGKNLGLMPCMKGKKINEKSKIKVDVLRNVSRPVPKVFVGPGRSREKGNGPCREKPEEFRKKVNVVTGEQLDRPEYNSIICTIKQLDEAKKKKIVGNIDALPVAYKDLLNEKVSSALDFPPCESVFHDLVDISIDEKQLPARLTRSRDPEPRPKDLTPKLSDFFVPQFAEDYSVAVRVQPRIPEINDNWSGFRISEKINDWKLSLNGS